MTALDRLVDGRTIADVLAEDERQRQREAAEREQAMFDAYLSGAFGLEPAKRPEPKPKSQRPDTNRDPDLHGGARKSVEGDDGAAIDAYVERFFPGTV